MVLDVNNLWSLVRPHHIPGFKKSVFRHECKPAIDLGYDVLRESPTKFVGFPHFRLSSGPRGLPSQEKCERCPCGRGQGCS